MNFYENQEILKKHLIAALHVNKERIKKTVALCNYLDSEFYDANNEEEIQVNSHIEKQIETIAKKMKEFLDESFSDETLIFGHNIPSFYEKYEGIFYLWGITTDQEKPLENPTFSKHPRSVLAHEQFITLVDLRKGIEFIPWNQ